MKFHRRGSSGPVAAPTAVLLAVGLTCSSGSAFAAGGAITEYAIPSGIGGFDIVAGPDGNLWVTEPGGSSGNKVAKVTTSGSFTEYTAPNPPFYIAAGPDGNLWFTEVQTNNVGKVTTTGAFTEYAIPTANSSPEGIAAGPDGNLWFTEQNANKVAKVTTLGAFTEYPIPTANSASYLIAAGSDGNLWFTEYGGNKVARVTTSGAFTEYPIPTASSGPLGIAVGSDGNLWFIESLANKMAKLTTSGSFTEYALPTANSGPGTIAAGPDGNLWFTEQRGNKVAKVTTSGWFTEYAVPTANNESDGIAAGPDGNMWFPERSVGKVAKVVASTGLLRIASSPAVATQIYVDSGIADSWGLTWLKLAPGFHKLKFTHVDGYTEPPPQAVNVNDGATTTITGTFSQRGWLRVITSPAVPSQISVDGNPTDEWGMWTDIPTGPHTVCFGALAGWDAPPCQTITLTTAGMTVAGNFRACGTCTGQSGVGRLRVTTNPALPSQITIQPSGAAVPYIADHWGLTGLELSAVGSPYTVCFQHVIGWTEPLCQTVIVANGSTTTVVGNFVQRGSLRVLTSPPAAGTIFVDGIPRNDWGMWTDIPNASTVGSHTVCFAPAVGFSLTPPCQTVAVTPGATTTVTGRYR